MLLIVSESNLSNKCFSSVSSVKECLRGEVSQEALRAWYLKQNAVGGQTTMGELFHCGSPQNKFEVCRLLKIYKFLRDNVIDLVRNEEPAPCWNG
jgi:hypothetical protein